ncbi:NAD(P)-dependent oxidoreductase [Enterovirga aerilata]|uniref:NAD(P)-dependent oxidoreductase n=1 Tax=Enterovirga aerilata TaxID=2730920 RepID=A0A849IG32_9HYPH|nr:NAD(P)-dependent oxidoreductase [Enterovirga sp. DB1703]NNM75130.1 NAD(P)-dependent oxidoreductase [Enterovirga sp. DB1703]
MAETIGFIGLGNMGTPMAIRLADAGYGLVVFDTRDDVVAPFVARGAKRAASAADVGSQAETVLVSLPTPDIVQKVVSEVGQGTAVKTVVDLSTTGPRVATAIAAAMKERGITFVDSPVSGGVGGAKAGTLAVMVSCPRQTFERLEPMLKHIGKVFFIGEAPGAAQMMKLCNNLMSAAAMAISAEAITAGVKAGIDPAVMVDVINVSSGMNTATTQKFPRSILNRRFDYGFATGLMFKDVRLCLEEAESMGLDLETAKAVRSVWQKMNDQFGPESDFTRIVEMVERPAGVTVGKPG